MDLKKYLDATGQSYEDFAALATVYSRRCRPIAKQTIQGIVAGAGCHTDTAEAIIAASRAKPAPDGGTVDLLNLVTRRLTRRQRRKLKRRPPIDMACSNGIGGAA